MGTKTLFRDQEFVDLTGAICAGYDDDIAAFGIAAHGERNGRSAGVAYILFLQDLAGLVEQANIDALVGVTGKGNIDVVAGGVGIDAHGGDETEPDGLDGGVFVGAVFIYQLKAVFLGALCRFGIRIALVDSHA